MANAKLVRGEEVRVRQASNKAYYMKLNVIVKLREYALTAKGNLVTVRPSKIAQEINHVGRITRADGVIIRNFLEQLVEVGYMEIIKRSARGKVYGFRRNSEFWNMLITKEPREIVESIEMLFR